MKRYYVARESSNGWKVFDSKTFIWQGLFPSRKLAYMWAKYLNDQIKALKRTKG